MSFAVVFTSTSSGKLIALDGNHVKSIILWGITQGLM